MRCPTCGFEGEFNKARPPFFVFDVDHSLSERDRAKRSSVCPHCGTTITIPAKLDSMMITIFLFLIVVGLAIGVGVLAWNQFR